MTPIETWAGADLSTIGPIYPMVGSEFLLWILGLAFWIAFHIMQGRIEAQYLFDHVVYYVWGSNLLLSAGFEDCFNAISKGVNSRLVTGIEQQGTSCIHLFSGKAIALLFRGD